MLWYSPILFQKPYLAALNRPADFFEAGMKTNAVKTLYLPWGVGILCSAVALYVVIHFLHFIKNGLTREGATSIVFWGWLGFSAMPSFATLGWNQTPLSLFLITQGSRFLTGLVATLAYVELSTRKSGKAAAAAAAPAPAAAEETPASPRGRGRSRSPRSAKVKKKKKGGSALFVFSSALQKTAAK